MQYRHRGNSTGCLPGSTEARQWRWALEGAVAHTQLQGAWEESPSWPASEESHGGCLKIKMPNYFGVYVINLQKEQLVLKYRQKRVRNSDFLHYFSIRKPETWFCDIQQFGAEATGCIKQNVPFHCHFFSPRMIQRFKLLAQKKNHLYNRIKYWHEHYWSNIEQKTSRAK